MVNVNGFGYIRHVDRLLLNSDVNHGEWSSFSDVFLLFPLRKKLLKQMRISSEASLWVCVVYGGDLTQLNDQRFVAQCSRTYSSWWRLLFRWHLVEWAIKHLKPLWVFYFCWDFIVSSHGVSSHAFFSHYLITENCWFGAQLVIVMKRLRDTNQSKQCVQCAKSIGQRTVARTSSRRFSWYFRWLMVR